MIQSRKYRWTRWNLAVSISKTNQSRQKSIWKNPAVAKANVMRLLVARVSLSIEEYVTWRHSWRERFSRLFAQHSFADSPQNLDNAHPLRRPKKTKIWQEFSWNLQCSQQNRRTAALHVPVCLNVKAFHITDSFATWRASCRVHTRSRAALSTWKIQHVDCLGTCPLKVCWCELLLTEHSRVKLSQNILVIWSRCLRSWCENLVQIWVTFWVPDDIFWRAQFIQLAFPRTPFCFCGPRALQNPSYQRALNLTTFTVKISKFLWGRDSGISMKVLMPGLGPLCTVWVLILIQTGLMIPIHQSKFWFCAALQNCKAKGQSFQLGKSQLGIIQTRNGRHKLMEK